MASVDLHEKANFTRLSRLLVDKGTEALRTTLDAIHPPANLPAVLNANRTLLLKLKPRVINNAQWDLLFPPSGNPPDSKTFDVSLITILLRNVCGVHPPATGWNTMPPDTDNSLEANIARIKLFRNYVYAHATTTRVDQTTFDKLWQKISQALFHLKIPQKEIDNLKICPLSPDEEIYVQTLHEWALTDNDCKNMLADVQQQLCQSGLRQRDREENLNTSMQHLTQLTEETHRGVQQLCHTSSKQTEDRRVTYEFEEIKALQRLAKHNFKSKIRHKVKLFHPGTRNWLLERVEHWFTTESAFRLLLITAGPGFGKSVFAAKVCEVFREKGKLAACHFCDFSDSNLKDPLMMLQSLASHMSENIAGFKDKLDDQLNRPHKVQNLKDAFQIYLQNPLDELEVEPSLIVIDGLDESAIEDKSEMVKLIAKYFPDLPESVKVLITSRPGLSLQMLKDIQTIEIDAEDKENNSDLLQYLNFSLPSLLTEDTVNQPRQSHHCTDFSRKVLPAVVKKCEGSFLYAFHVQCELSKREEIDTMSLEEIMAYLPEGMGSVYQEYFHRLEIELKVVMNENANLFKLLEMLVANQKSLPLNFIARALALDLDCRNVRKIIDKVNEAVSCLLYVSEDSVTVFHKSVYDWLLARGYQHHEYTVKVTEGKKWLWLACEQIFNEIKRTVSSGNGVKLTNEVTHGLENGHTYLLECNMKDSFSWLVDMIIVHVLLTVNQNAVQNFLQFRSNLRNVLQREVAMNLQLQQKISCHYLESTYQMNFTDLQIPSSGRFHYIESVVDHSPEGCFTDHEKKIAETLFRRDTRLLKRSSIVTKPMRSLLAKVFPSEIVAIGLSSSKKLVAVALDGGTICILSLPNLVKLWQYSTEFESISCCTFALDDSFVLYGTLQTVLNIADRKKVVFFKGRVEKFKSCAFSPNRNRLVTVHALKIIKVWDIFKQSLTTVLDAGVPVDCFSFSKSGLFMMADQKNDSQDSYCVWNAITFQRVDQRRLSFRKSKHIVIKSEKCNRCFRLETKELIPRRKFEIETGSSLLVRHSRSLSKRRETETSTGMYNGLDCILSLNEHSFRIIDRIHFTTLAAWDIYLKACTPFFAEPSMVLNIVAIQDDNWLYSDQEKLVFFSTSAPKKDRPLLSCLTRILWCCFSPDGARLATCTSDGFVNLWDVDICQVYQRFQVNVETSSAACWWSNNYLFVFHIFGNIPSMSKYPVDENFKIMVSQEKPVPLCDVVEEFLPFSGIIDFSEGFLSFECGEKETVKVLDVNRTGHPKVIRLPGSRPMMSIAVSVGASFVLGVDGEVIILWKRSDAHSTVYEVVRRDLVSTLVLFPAVDLMYECCFNNDSNFGVVFLLTPIHQICLVIEVNTLKAMKNVPIVPRPPSSRRLLKVFCTNTLVVLLTPLFIEIFDLKTLTNLGYSIQRNLNLDLFILSKLCPKGTVLAVPKVTCDMEFFQLNSPDTCLVSKNCSPTPKKRKLEMLPIAK